MFSQKTILLITKRNEKITNEIEEICNDTNITLSKLYDICDVIPAVTEARYNMLIIDCKHCQSGADLLRLFKTKAYYVPTIVLIADKKPATSYDNVKIVKRNCVNQINDIIKESVLTQTSLFPENHTTYLRSTIEKELQNLGFSKKYKGFDYMSEIVMKILNNNTFKKSFKKFVYPFISSLYNVSASSVERDIRNLICKNQNKAVFQQKFEIEKLTTRLVVESVVSHIRDYLNKLGNYKINF